MPAISPHALSFWVRWVHTASMGVLLGGTMIMWVEALGRQPGGAGGLLSPLAERFEMIFWLALGVQVITGIGNLGAFGAGLPQPASAWGSKLILKLVLVLGLFLLSLLRTLIVARLRRLGAPATQRLQRLGAGLYGATTLVLAGIVLLAVSLAHG